jgi:hypothetical protein
MKEYYIIYPKDILYSIPINKLFLTASFIFYCYVSMYEKHTAHSDGNKTVY